MKENSGKLHFAWPAKQPICGSDEPAPRTSRDVTAVTCGACVAAVVAGGTRLKGTAPKPPPPQTGATPAPSID
jgi:hypothetical protein